MKTNIYIYIFDHISLNYFYNEKIFRQNCRENQNIHFMFNTFFFSKKL